MNKAETTQPISEQRQQQYTRWYERRLAAEHAANQALKEKNKNVLPVRSQAAVSTEPAA